jgi:hypothetical protein
MKISYCIEESSWRVSLPKGLDRVNRGSNVCVSVGNHRDTRLTRIENGLNPGVLGLASARDLFFTPDDRAVNSVHKDVRRTRVVLIGDDHMVENVPVLR